MSLRELVVLGTASQVPTRERNHHACFLRFDDQGFLFDPGEGTQRQMLIAGIPSSAITRICITHFHGDHCLGLASMVQRLSLDRVEHQVEVLFPRSGQPFYERLIDASIYHRAAWIQPRPLPESGAEVAAGPLTIVARPLEHAVPTLGYRIQERDERRFLPDRLAELGINGPAVGELQRAGSLEHGGRRIAIEEVSLLRRGSAFAFVMDTRPSPGALELARDVDLLVAEATYLEAEAAIAREHFHMTAADAARLALEAGARALVLSHFSQRYPDLGPFREQAAAIFPAVEAARDFDRFPVPRRS